MSFGDNLKKIRSDKDISQGDLAKMIDVHATHISRYERNLTSPTIDVAKKIADALEVSTDALIYGSNEQIINNKINDDELLQLFHKIQYLNQEEISSIKTMLKAFVFQKDIQKQLS
ncbi:helix-turn-helix domain-containing protein [Flavobacterium oreochromis]|uniref:helix-turn-helix domain-containing protein n=2 Tax=Flavobacterium oreochromis TaxID=2906078 RepID=UPI001CE5D559|nr:helix-turn-helix transcriptional regulator [Flavobacterium oreochromis]QYS87087.1 helix-turn-helix transcriptional regulator [Flavobacterium oreochromis]